MLFKTLRSVAASSLMSIAILAVPAGGAQQIANNVPEGVRQASDLGRVAPSQEITITVQLQMKNKTAFDKAVDALYDPESPTFHKWLTEEDLKQYAPAREQADAVRKELESHGLEILSADEDGFSLRARGTAASVESAFNTRDSRVSA